MARVEAVRIRGAGGPEVLELSEIELREPTGTEVLVRVAAAGLNRADCLQRRGFYPAPTGVPEDVPGLEFAGEIEAVGESVVGFKPGQRVMGIVGGGGMATHLLTESRELLSIPEGMSFEDAAAIPEVFLTAFDAMMLQGGLERGQTALVHAVASGVGTAAVQLARAIGATSVGTSRTADKLERCGPLGMDHGILVEDGKFAAKVLEVAPAGANVVLDTVGAAYLGENVKALAKRGRVIVIGLLGGVKGELNLGALLAKRGSIVGSVLRSRTSQAKARLAEEFAAQMLPKFSDGGLAPVVDDVMSMKDVAEAHRRMDANETFGKIVLRWD